MSLELVINDKLKEAMKAGDKVRLDALRSIRAAIIEFNKSGSDQAMDETATIKLLSNLAKKRKDAIEMYTNGGRPELAEKEQIEFNIIQEFMPAMMSKEDIETIVKEVISAMNATGPQDLGKVIGASMKKTAGKADGALVQQVVKYLLGIS
jgi:uncharacterized protein YqeY